jgi:hypothetical protein
MARAFQYKPKFIDIRVRPPSEDDDVQKDVYSLKPGEKPCDHPDCRKAGETRAPKSPELMNQYYWFCQPHAAEYNRNWNFFAGMTDEEVDKRQIDERMTGGRPTWDFKASSRSRTSAAAKRGPKGEVFSDPFAMFGGAKGSAPVQGRHLGKLERNAFADLDLLETADGPTIRARYTELVKRCHPDANGGDRSAEHKLQRVIKAYQTLRKAKLA